MEDPVPNIEDLEDGEIESNGEDDTEPQSENFKQDVSKDNTAQITSEVQTLPAAGKAGKKKKKNKSDKSKNKEKKNRKLTNPKPEEDFAGSVEKAIRKAMNKTYAEDKDVEGDHSYDEVDDRRKRKRRKRYDGKDAKKRRQQDLSEEVDESEMMMVRGASPVREQSKNDDYHDDDRDSYASDGSHEEMRNQLQHQRPQRHRQQQRDRKNANNKNDRNDRRRGVHPMQDPDGVCLYFMQGKCHKGDDCMFSHDALPPRKLELCKFYLMECCAKRDKCLYLHGDFPCKYYHTGLPCIYKDECKFAHGPPLNENFRNILLKHIESAPKEILGDFPRLNREAALKMMQTTQMKLMQKFGGEPSQAQDNKDIPSIFELNLGRPQNSTENDCNNDKQNKFSPKMRQSRWQNENINNVLAIKNLTGVLTPRQITDLNKMGIENLDQLSQLTVLQLNNIGISLKQTAEIQLNTMSIQKLGLINSESPAATVSGVFPPLSGTQDLDLRIPPVVAIPNTSVKPTDFPGQDIDMRFQPVVAQKDDKEVKKSRKDTIDIDQYTKDALKFASKEKEDICGRADAKDEKPNVSVETKDVDHRVLPFPEEPRPSDNNSVKREEDIDIRFAQPDHIFKSPAKRTRRSTTDDDEENNLLIDEKWYSSDEDKSGKKKSPAHSPQIMSPPQVPVPHVIESAAFLNRLGDLSKIDISEEVTKLLNTMKNNLHEPKADITQSDDPEPQKTRDPRARRSPPSSISSPKIETIKTTKKLSRVTIYECVDGEPTDGRRRSDVDLREIPAFGDTDLRQSSGGDIDFRLGLPFKPLPNYTPASEIDGSFNSHPPIPYKLLKIDIPRPDYTDIRNSTAKSQALVDPRLRKVFRLSTEDSNSDSEKSSKSTTVAANAPRVDPRRKPKEADNSSQEQKSLDLQVVIQNSDWYKGLSSTQKIFVNQQIATVTTMVKQFHQDKSLGKKIDLTAIHSNSVFNSIFSNLGICLVENGEFTYLPKPKEGLLQTPNFSQNTGHYGMNTSIPGGIDNPNMNMNMMNMQAMGMSGQMNSMGMGNMPGYNHSYPDPRGGPTPGLLGIAPNIPHNFNGNNFQGPNYGNMPYNGPGNDFGSMDDNYSRFPNRGGNRGRGNDRWHRGGGGRGGPRGDRKNYNDRGNWKNN